MYVTCTYLNINTHKQKSPARTPFKGCLDFHPPPSLSFVTKHAHIQEPPTPHNSLSPSPRSPPSSTLLCLTSVCQSGVRGVSLQSVLSCCFVESGGLWGVSTGDHCGQTSSRRRCTGMVSLQSGSAGVGTAHPIGRTCRKETQDVIYEICRIFPNIY